MIYLPPLCNRPKVGYFGITVSAGDIAIIMHRVGASALVIHVGLLRWSGDRGLCSTTRGVLHLCDYLPPGLSHSTPHFLIILVQLYPAVSFLQLFLGFQEVSLARTKHTRQMGKAAASLSTLEWYSGHRSYSLA